MKTYPRVVELLAEKRDQAGSVNAVVKKTDLSHNTITNYLEGEGSQPAPRAH